jgi:hypothetical protein
VSSGCRIDEGDRRRGPGNALPDLRKLDELRAIRDDNKVHGCQLLADAALRPASRMPSRSAGQSAGGVLAHVATRADGVPGLHVSVRLHAGQGRGCTVAGGARSIAAARRHPTHAGYQRSEAGLNLDPESVLRGTAIKSGSG